MASAWYLVSNAIVNSKNFIRLAPTFYQQNENLNVTSTFSNRLEIFRFIKSLSRSSEPLFFALSTIFFFIKFRVIVAIITRQRAGYRNFIICLFSSFHCCLMEYIFVRLKSRHVIVSRYLAKVFSPETNTTWSADIVVDMTC